MFYLIRSISKKNVLGIISVLEVIPQHTASVEDSLKLIGIIEWNLNIGPGHWKMEPITQAEYETYRDLHGFRVFRCYTAEEHIEWIRKLTDQLSLVEDTLFIAKRALK